MNNMTNKISSRRLKDCSNIKIILLEILERIIIIKIKIDNLISDIDKESQEKLWLSKKKSK